MAKPGFTASIRIHLYKRVFSSGSTISSSPVREDADRTLPRPQHSSYSGANLSFQTPRFEVYGKSIASTEMGGDLIDVSRATEVCSPTSPIFLDTVCPPANSWGY